MELLTRERRAMITELFLETDAVPLVELKTHTRALDRTTPPVILTFALTDAETVHLTHLAFIQSHAMTEG